MVDFGLQLKKSRVAETAKGIQVVPTLAKLTENSSASQIKTWKRCKRLWAAQKIWGIKERAKQHFIIGHALHSVAERYITGQVTSWDALFPAGWNKGLDETESAWIKSVSERAVAKGVWQAIPDSLIEFPIAFLVGDEHVDARGLPLLARAETYHDEQGVRKVAKPVALYDGSPLPAGWNRLPPYVGFIDHLRLWEDAPKIADHKTAKHRGYATTPAKLAEDLQVLSYAAVPLVIRPEIDTVGLIHNVFLKNADAPDPVYAVAAVAPLAKVQQTWKEIRQSSAEMQQVRRDAPRINDPANPYRRADNWQKVKGAIEEARPEACKEYGGCPLRDLCQGRCTAEQIVRRMDSPDPLELVRRAPAAEQKKPTFGLVIKSKTQPVEFHFPDPYIEPPTTSTVRPPEIPMPFASRLAPALAVGQDVYVLDPEDATTQLRARIVELNAEGAARVVLYPNPDVQPDFATIGIQYQPADFMPKDQILTIPHPTAKIRSYQEVLQANKITEGVEWTPAPVAGAPTLAATAKPTTKPERDGAFGLKGSTASTTTIPATTTATTAPAVAPVVPPPMTTPAPEWAKAIREGARLVVAQTDHPRWKQYAGKLAVVTAIAPGDREGSLLFSVDIEGFDHVDVNANRFEPIRDAVAGAAASQATTTALEAMTIQQRAAALVGKNVGVVLNSTNALTNCVLEAADETGITILGGKVKPWADVKSLDVMGKIPGAPPSKEEKAAAKEAAKAQKQAKKEAAKAAAKAQDQQNLPGTDPAPTVSPAGALDSAIEAAQAVLNGGKVTRKALEGILPLLQSARQHQTNLEGVTTIDVPGAPKVPPKAPPLFKPSEIGRIVDEAKGLIAKASDMLAQVIEF